MLCARVCRVVDQGVSHLLIYIDFQFLLVLLVPVPGTVLYTV